MKDTLKVLALTTLATVISSVAAYTAAGGAVHSLSLPETRIELKPGVGLQKVETYCNICHSLDYVTTQPKFSKAQWTATVNKMIKVMGAQISEEDAKIIIDYLAAQYGTGK